MSGLFERIRDAALAGRYFIGAHAGNQLDERGIPDWQVLEGIARATLLRERPQARPNPVVELDQLLPDGTKVKAVWSYLPRHKAAKLVTVHYYDR